MNRLTFRGLDKRRFVRVDSPLRVTLCIIRDGEAPDNTHPIRVRSCNISREGICLETGQIIINSVNMLSGAPGARDNLLKMEIELAPGQPPIKTKGEVCWYDVTRDSEEFMYQVGVCFVEIDDGDSERIKAFVKSNTRKPGFFRKLFFGPACLL